MDQGRGKGPAKKPELPQWNSKFRYSAQKPAADAGGAKKDAASKDAHHGSKTPLGQPRRVPVAGKAAGGHQNHQGDAPKEQQQQPRQADAPSTSGQDADTTPTACLFQRFESLTLATPAAKPSPTPAREQQAPPTAANAAAAPQQRRSVAFGTPSVLCYTPAGGAPVPLDGTPLWSNAGHTPFSLEQGRDAAGGGIREVVVCEGGHLAADDGAAVSAQLFTSVITDTEPQRTPAATVACPRSPAELPQPPAEAGAEAAAESAAGSSDDAAATPPAGRLASAGSFRGFDTGLRGAGAGGCPGTPPAFSRTQSKAAAAAGADAACPATPAATPARAAAGTAVPVTPAAKEWLQLMSVGAVGSSHLPMPTPKSKLKQPERVKSAVKPAIPAELRQLLSDPAAAGVVAAQPCEEPLLLGSCDVLSPVRARREQQHSMGAGQQVLTPVRRSARKVKESLAGARLQPMLEATNYCYQPNAAIPGGLDRVQEAGRQQ